MEEDTSRDSESGDETSENVNNQLAVRQDNLVKSTAVVKYSNLEIPALYHELQPNTNLNEAPANWLHGESKLESYLRDLSLTRDKSFSSFKIAHCFPEQAADVDVISDGENIKKLLKMPYSKGQVSMIVHRVGSTLLLDDFDIHKHLLRQQQSDWSWLREFYQNFILHSMEQAMKDKLLVKKNKSRESLQNRDMFSKFLYRSVIGQENEHEGFDASAFPGILPEDARVETLENQTIPDPLSQPRLDQSDHQRTVMWTFEDLRMLIGTDLPIFGGSSHPCVSLRLRDMRKPINVLTGIDYWLDNLMCNVPELAMCYHLDGIVQSYELLKTEDIPNLEDSKFAPKVVKDIAQNILSFLKANATREGHTYWLYKGHGDDVVKLYDLTTLMEDYDTSEQNPFKVPVGVLLYRVARNMRQNSGRQKSGTIKILLENCLLLLDQESHSQVVTSAHYLLSDLYMSDNIYDQNLPPPDDDESESDMDDEPTPTCDMEEEEEEEEAGEQEEDVDRVPSVSMDVEALRDPQTEKNLRQPVRLPITGPVEERSVIALQHIAEGLQCLDRNVIIKDEEVRQKHKVETQESADPNTAIPLHYASLDPTWMPNINNSQQSSQDSTSPNQVSVIKRSSLPKGTWHVLSKTLLLKKAAVVYLALAEKAAAKGTYGQALRNIRLALLCFSGMQQLMPSKQTENCHILVALLGVAGDVHLMVAHNQDKGDLYENQANNIQAYDTAIQESVERDIADFEYSWMNQFTSAVIHNLQRSVLCYEACIEAVYVNKNVALNLSHEPYTKRLGNVRNELGVHFMNQAANLISEAGCQSPSEVVQDLWKKSYTCFVSGIQAFETLEDKINMALLHSNCGRLMRLCARAYASYDDTGQHMEMVVQEKHYYSKAADEYLKTLSLLKQPSQAAEITHSVTWELSSTYFTWATTLQDHAPLSSTSQEQVEKDVTELMTKALKYCDCNSESARLGTCQYRAATIHHRLASLYHNAYRNQLNDQKKKHQRSLADLHYEKAIHYFSLCDSPCEMLRVQLERVAMCEYQLARQISPAKKLKTLQCSLSHLLFCSQPLRFVYSQLTDPKEDGMEVVQMYQDELNKLLSLLDERLKFTLLNMVRNAAPPKKSKSSSTHLDIYRAVYAAVIKKQACLPDADITHRCLSLRQTLDEVATACDVPATSAPGTP